MSPTEFRVGPCRSHRLFESLAVRRGLRFVQARAAPNIESALSSLRGTLFPGGSTFRPATEYAKKHRSHDSETVTWSVAGSRVLVVLLQRNLAARSSLESSSGNSSTNESNPEIYRVRRGLAGSRQLLRFIDGCPDRDEAGLLRRKYPSSDRADLFDFETPAVSPGPSRGRKISANWSYSSLVENTKSRPSGLGGHLSGHNLSHGTPRNPSNSGGSPSWRTRTACRIGGRADTSRKNSCDFVV